MHLASHDARLVRLLVEAGAELDAAMPNGATPLLIAIGRAGSSAVVDELLRRGADPSMAMTDFFHTPFAAVARAAEAGEVPLVERLLQQERVRSNAAALGAALVRSWFQLCVGMVQYRLGDYAAAESTLAAVELTGMYERLSTVPIYRAMVALQQGRNGDADRLLGDAAKRMRPLPAERQDPFAYGGDHDDLIAWLAWGEVQALRRERK